MKEVHNIHNHKIKTVEGYWVLPGQTIYVDDEGKKCSKPEDDKKSELGDLSDYVTKAELPVIKDYIKSYVLTSDDTTQEKKVYRFQKDEDTNAYKNAFIGVGLVVVSYSWGFSHSRGGGGGTRHAVFIIACGPGSTLSTNSVKLCGADECGLTNINEYSITVTIPKTTKDGNTTNTYNFSDVRYIKLF